MADQIERAQEELATALARFERSKASLFMPDGGKRYADAVHDNLLTGYIQALHDVAGELDAAVEAEIAASNSPATSCSAWI